jgi:pyrroloquinoline quinone biosynthesis protein D
MPSTPTPPEASFPKLAAHARLRDDAQSGAMMLLYPEGALVLDDTSTEILKRCDGGHTVEAIAAELAEIFEGNAAVIVSDVRDCLRELEERGLVHLNPRPS